MKKLGTLAFYLCLLGSIAQSQQVVIESPITREVLPLEPLNQMPVAPPVVTQAASVAANGVTLRALDKISGEVVDFQLAPGQTKQLGRIQVSLNECRFPTDNPSGDASAHLIIRNVADQSQAFSGWMIASSPALNGLDHSRYDVWVLRCITS